MAVILSAGHGQVLGPSMLVAGVCPLGEPAAVRADPGTASAPTDGRLRASWRWLTAQLYAAWSTVRRYY